LCDFRPHDYFVIVFSYLLCSLGETVEMNPKDTCQVGTVEVLDIEHRQAFEQALMRVLGTDVAENTFAQVIDGLPTYESYAEFHWPQDGHPATHHTELCSGMLDKAREFRSAFVPKSLSFQLPVRSNFPW
jgi:hypothetical protein